MSHHPEAMLDKISLAKRSTLATLVALVAFLGLTGAALDHAYYESALQGLKSRLKDHTYALVAAANVTPAGQLQLDDMPIDVDFLRPDSGLYAVISSDSDIYWSSPSLVGRSLPPPQALARGQLDFSGPVNTDVGKLYMFSLHTVYETAGKPLDLTFTVARSEERLLGQWSVYRRILFAWLLGLGLMLLILQWLLVHWSLLPVWRVSSDLGKVKNGEQDLLTGQYPIELRPLTRGINTFIHSEREALARYRHTLDDLAHSLKTPLAVMRARLESNAGHDPVKKELMTQVERMGSLVGYQLSRAATSGYQTFATPVEVIPKAEDIVQSLEKVYAEKGVLCEFDIDEDGECFFYGEPGDLFELLGNLLDNAFKWSKGRVLMRMHAVSGEEEQLPGLCVVVEDDGEGIAPEKVESVLQRGVRNDERVQGHGIGLAIVQDIVTAYHAELEVGRSPELGGALFRVNFKARSN